jgi:hypothetical protein
MGAAPVEPGSNPYTNAPAPGRDDFQDRLHGLLQEIAILGVSFL